MTFLLLGAAPTRAVDRLPLQGIWTIEDSGNPIYSKMIVSAYNALGQMQNRIADTPAPVNGIRFDNDGRMQGAQGQILRGEDGALTMSFGQFRYCMCVSVEYSVSPTGDPDVYEGTWTFEAKEGLKSGTTVWRRQPPARITRLYHRFGGANPEVRVKIRDEIAFGSRHMIVAAPYPTHGTVRYIAILGDRLAGGHDLWIDPASDIAIDTYHSGYLCHDGSVVGRDAWHRCGARNPLAGTVLGIQVRLVLGEAVTPGVKTLWLDGQPVAFNLVIDGHPAASDALAKLTEALAIEGDPLNAATKKVPYTTDRDVLTDWQARLRDRFDLSPEQWEALVDAYFYAGGKSRLHDWEGFEAFVDQRAISRERSLGIARMRPGFESLFAVPGDIFDALRTAYARDRLTADGVSDEERDEFLAYAFNRLLRESGPYRASLSEEAKVKLSQHEWESPIDDMPTVRPAKATDQIWGCSFTQVLQRMKDADPQFRVKWNFYMTQPIGYFASIHPGPTGGGMNHKRVLLHRGVLVAMEQCERSVH